MARHNPTLEELILRVQNTYREAFNIDDSTELGKQFLLTDAIAIAGILKPMYLRMSSIQKNILWDLAESSTVGGTLDRWAELFLGRSKFPATQGTYIAEINPTGTGTFEIKQGDTFKRPNGDALYIAQADVTGSGTGVTVVLKSADAGSLYALEIGQILEPTTPKIEIKTVTITEETSAPVDEETDEELSDRINEERSLSPTGGSASDYRKWALDLPIAPQDLRIRKLFIYAKSGAPQILECFIEQIATDLDPINPPSDALPDAIKLALYDSTDPENQVGYFMYDESVITPSTTDIHGRKPLGVWDIEISNVNIIQLDVRIAGLNSGSEQESVLIERITKEIHAFIYEIRPRVPGADNPNTIKDTVRESDIIGRVNYILTSDQYFQSIEIYEGGNRIETPNLGERRFSGADVPSTLVTIL